MKKTDIAKLLPFNNLANQLIPFPFPYNLNLKSLSPTTLIRLFKKNPLNSSSNNMHLNIEQTRNERNKIHHQMTKEYMNEECMKNEHSLPIYLISLSFVITIILRKETFQPLSTISSRSLKMNTIVWNIYLKGLCVLFLLNY